LAAADDPIYRKMDGWRFDDKQEKCLQRRKNLGIAMPCFSEEILMEKVGPRKYFFCSYEKMFRHVLALPLNERVFYELATHDTPCHFYIDADFTLDELAPGARMPDFDGGIAQFLGLLDEARILIRDSYASGDPLRDAWDFEWKDVVICTLTSDSASTKLSKHLMMHFPGLRMLKNPHEHAKRWYTVAHSLRKHKYPDDATNPMMYKHVSKGLVSIVDNSVYTPNRNFRLIGNAKMRSMGQGIRGHLWPACKHGADQTCVEANCLHKVQHKFTEYDFLSNLACFIPLSAVDGKPMPVNLMLVPDKFDDNLPKTASNRYSTIQRPAYRQAAAASLQPSSPMLLSIGLGDANNSNHSFASSSSSSNSNSNGVPSMSLVTRNTSGGSSPLNLPDPSLSSICHEIAAMLTRQTRYTCRYLHQKGPRVHVFQSDSRECQLKLEDTNGACGVHRSNHQTISCTIKLPLPSFNIICRDPHCLERTTYTPSMSEEQREQVRRFPLEPQYEIFKSIIPRLVAYVESQTLTAGMLMNGFQ